jgi:hypothetical protein
MERQQLNQKEKQEHKEPARCWWTDEAGRVYNNHRCGVVIVISSRDGAGLINTIRYGAC